MAERHEPVAPPPPGAGVAAGGLGQVAPPGSPVAPRDFVVAQPGLPDALPASEVPFSASTPAPSAPPAARYRFRRAQRLSGRRAFEAVYQANVRKTSGPLVVLALANALGHDRLGLSVSRRVGGAVRRNRIKRLLREAFRLMQHDWRDGYDLVVVVRPHDDHSLAEYQRLLFTAVRSLRKRLAGTSPATSPVPPAAPAAPPEASG